MKKKNSLNSLKKISRIEKGNSTLAFQNKKKYEKKINYRFTSTKASSQVRWASQDVSKSFGPHESMTILLNVLLHLFQSTAESLEYFFHVATFLHGDDPSVILLVDPDQEVLVFVVPDATSVRPVASHTSARQQR